MELKTIYKIKGYEKGRVVVEITTSTGLTSYTDVYFNFETAKNLLDNLEEIAERERQKINRMNPFHLEVFYSNFELSGQYIGL